MTVVTIIGGGFTGSLLALKLHEAGDPDLTIRLVERGSVAGKGVAYGACRPFHLLNVPAHRMELGLEPRFQDWLRPRYDGNGDLADAFVPRALFGAYVAERVAAANGHGIHVVRGEAAGITEDAKPKIILRDGRRLETDKLVIASGNFAPRPPVTADGWVFDTPLYIADPWANGALETISPNSDVLLIGTGLTAIDVALSLTADKHKSRIIALSRRGLIPLTHETGGEWKPFLAEPYPRRLSELTRIIREEAEAAAAQGVPWQRIPDTLRPQIAALWKHLDFREKARFLRHLRPWWDIHRHRMAPDIARRVANLKASGQFENEAGRITAYQRAGTEVEVSWNRRGGGTRMHRFAHVINCTGPDADVTQTGDPLLRDLLRRGFLTRDPLGLGIETRNGATADKYGRPSKWLYALGPLTRPAWWEIVAVPEIRLQVEQLAERLLNKNEAADDLLASRLLSDAFADLGAGI